MFTDYSCFFLRPVFDNTPWPLQSVVGMTNWFFDCCRRSLTCQEEPGWKIETTDSLIQEKVKLDTDTIPCHKTGSSTSEWENFFKDSRWQKSHQYHHDNWITIWAPWCPVRKKESDWRSAWLIGPQSTFLHNSHESIIIDTLQSILVFGLEIERHNHPPFHKWIRDGWRYQNGWIFRRIPNSLCLPPPSFSENHFANFSPKALFKDLYNV